MALTIFAGNAFKISISFPWCIESNGLLKSTNVSIAGSCLSLIPSMSLRSDKICENVDLPARNPYWFTLSRGS